MDSSNGSECPLVIDTGTYSCRVGLSRGPESDTPSVSIPSVVGRKESRFRQAMKTLKRSTLKRQFATGGQPRTEEHKVRRFANPNPKARFLGGQHGLSGEEAEKYHFRSPFCELDNSIEHWDDLEDLWGHAIVNELRTRPDSHPVLVAEPLGGFDMRSRERLLEVLFETFNVPALCLENQMVLSLFGTGRTDGCVLSSGHSKTSAVPIYQGRVLTDCFHTSPVAGRSASEFLASLLQRENTDALLHTRTSAGVKQFRHRSSGSSTATTSTTGRRTGVNTSFRGNELFAIQGEDEDDTDSSMFARAKALRKSFKITKGSKSDSSISRNAKQRRSSIASTSGEYKMENINDIKHSMGYVAKDFEAEIANFHNRQTNSALSLSVRELGRSDSFFPRRPILSTSVSALTSAVPPGLGIMTPAAVVDSQESQPESYVLPDGTEVNVGSAAFQVGELAFNPGLLARAKGESGSFRIRALESSPLSVQNLVYMAIGSAKDAFSMHFGPTSNASLYEKSLWKDIVVTGGNTAFPGFANRLQCELEELSNTEQHVVQICQPDSSLNAAWAGGSLLASLNSGGEGWITVDDYEAFGAGLVHNRCPVMAGFAAATVEEDLNV